MSTASRHDCKFVAGATAVIALIFAAPLCCGAGIEAEGRGREAVAA